MEAETAALTHQQPAPRRRLAKLLRPALLLTAVSLLAWGGWRLYEIQDELGRYSNESRGQARQNQEKLQSLGAKVDALEALLAQTQARQSALEATAEELSKSRDERLLAEIEQSVTIAAQQLQLAGNVDAALLALQRADAGLARIGQAQLLPLRRLVNRDIDRLKALPLADVPGIALKLEGVVAAVDTLPLAFEQRPRAQTEAVKTPTKPASWWQGLGRDLWAEVRGLIRVERMDSGETALLAPNQVFFLRENLKLRLINARLALLQRDGRSFREDLRQARDWLDHYFDRRAKPVDNAIATLNALIATELSIDAPSLNETLAAFRNIKLRPGGAIR